jgi:hypothetical protein
MLYTKSVIGEEIKATRKHISGLKAEIEEVNTDLHHDEGIVRGLEDGETPWTFDFDEDVEIVDAPLPGFRLLDPHGGVIAEPYTTAAGQMKEAMVAKAALKADLLVARGRLRRLTRLWKAL